MTTRATIKFSVYLVLSLAATSGTHASGQRHLDGSTGIVGNGPTADAISEPKLSAHKSDLKAFERLLARLPTTEQIIDLARAFGIDVLNNPRMKLTEVGSAIIGGAFEPAAVVRNPYTGELGTYDRGFVTADRVWFEGEELGLVLSFDLNEPQFAVLQNSIEGLLSGEFEVEYAVVLESAKHLPLRPASDPVPSVDPSPAPAVTPTQEEQELFESPPIVAPTAELPEPDSEATDSTPAKAETAISEKSEEPGAAVRIASGIQSVLRTIGGWFSQDDPQTSSANSLSGKDKDEIMEYVRTAKKVGDGLREIDPSFLDQYSDEYGAQWWDIFSLMMDVDAVGRHLRNGEYSDATVLASNITSNKIIGSTAIGSTVKSSMAIASLATLPAAILLNDYANMLLEESLQDQYDAYKFLRNTYGFSHESIVKNRIDYNHMVVHYDLGFIYQINDNSYTGGYRVLMPPGSISSSDVYEICLNLFTAERNLRSMDNIIDDVFEDFERQ